VSTIRASGFRLTDVERLAEQLGVRDFRARDDSAFQMLLGDVQRLKQEIRLGSNSGAGGTQTGLTEADVLALIAGNSLDTSSIVSADASVTITPDTAANEVDLSVAAASTFNSRPFSAERDTDQSLTGSFADVGFTEVLDPSGSFSSDTYTFAVTGVFFAQFVINVDLVDTGVNAVQAAVEYKFAGTSPFASRPTSEAVLSAITTTAGNLDFGNRVDATQALAVSVTAGQTVKVQARLTVGDSATIRSALFCGFYLST
jgi:hypothetical protein